VKIRSITAFVGTRTDATAWRAIGNALSEARRRFTEAGYEVQTVRAALPPVAELASEASAVVALAIDTEEMALDAGIEYVAFGPWRPGDDPALARTLPEALDATESLFTTLRIDDGRRISPPAARLAAECIVRNAPLRENGFGNLRFAALARVPAGVPFLPAAYSDGASTSFAIAMESADLARESFESSADLDRCSQQLSASIESHAKRIEAIADSLVDDLFWSYGGADFSLATYPGDRDSVGATIESMGVSEVGQPGTALASALLAAAVQRADFRRAGFNGLFLPVLEDSVLAARAASGALRLEDLLLASTLCGTGLDTVPLPGDVAAHELVPYLLDLGALALRLSKPLTARLMPMPAMGAGDALDFDFPFFADGQVMDLRRRPAATRYDEQEWITVDPRHLDRGPHSGVDSQ
jgi:uncharacterized protein